MSTLEITTAVGCPLMCTYCPQEVLRASYGKETRLLTVDDYRVMLAKVPLHVRIDFSGMCEPWANRHCTDMLELTVMQGYRVAVYTTLVGMDVEDAQRFVGMVKDHRDQFDVICLHLPDAGGHMRGWRCSPEYVGALRAVMEAGARGDLGRVELMTMDAAGELHAELSSVLNGRLGTWRGCSRAASLDVKSISPLVGTTPRHEVPVSCRSTPFDDHNVLLPNGDVVLCCMDYGLKHVLGNLMREKYYEVFAGLALARLRVENRQLRYTEGSICRRCDNAATWSTAHGRWTAAPG